MGWVAPERGSSGEAAAGSAGTDGAGSGRALTDAATAAEEAQAVLEALLQRMGLSVTVTLRVDGERLLLEVHGGEARLVIGRRGATLEALQLLVNKILSRRSGGGAHHRVLIDTEGYRARRNEVVQAMGRDLAAQVQTERRSLVIYGMRAADRRALHVGLAGLAGVRTQSEGEGIERRLRIRPVAVDGTGGDEGGKSNGRDGGGQERARRERGDGG